MWCVVCKWNYVKTKKFKIYEPRNMLKIFVKPLEKYDLNHREIIDLI